MHYIERQEELPLPGTFVVMQITNGSAQTFAVPSGLCFSPHPSSCSQSIPSTQVSSMLSKAIWFVVTFQWTLTASSVVMTSQTTPTCTSQTSTISYVNCHADN